MVRYGVIGTGWITSAFIDATLEVDGLRLSAVYSRSKEKAEELALKYNVEHTFTNLEEMAKSDKIDAVYIASPNSFHYKQSKLFLENGKHVICEKPVAMSGELVSELISIANANHLVFMEAIMSMHMPQLEALEKALNKIGRISQAGFTYLQLSSKYPMLQKGEIPNVFNPLFETGSAMDIGVYCVYPALYLFSKYDNLSSTAVLHENGIDLCGSCILTYQDKAVTLSYSKIGNQRTSSEIVGDKGTIVIGLISKLNGIKIIYNDLSEEVISVPNHDINAMKYEAGFFYHAITDYEKNKVKLDKLNSLAVMVSDTLKEIRNKSGVSF